MTHTTKIIAAALIFSTAFSTNSFAQHSIASAKPTFNKNNIVSPASNATTMLANAKTEASFAALFPNASNPVWAAANDHYYVSFSNDGRKANASFTAKGKMNYCITDLTMENLPASFIKTIQKNYDGYLMIKSIEIKAYGTVAYQVIMENNSHYKTLKYTEDGVEEIQQVMKL